MCARNWLGMAAKQPEPEKRQRMKPLVDQERHQQWRPDTKHRADKRGIQPVQAISLQKANHEHDHRGIPQ
jgi:hypothetical protein